MRGKAQARWRRSLGWRRCVAATPSYSCSDSLWPHAQYGTCSHAVLRFCPSTIINSSGCSRLSLCLHTVLHFFYFLKVIPQLKDDVRAIERRLRDAQAAVAEQEEAMRAGEGEKRRAEQRRQEYTRQWSKDDDKLVALERSIQVCVAFASIAISRTLI